MAIESLKARLACDSAIHQKVVAVQCARLLAAFPADRMSEATARVRSDAYWTALKDKPAWAIDETVTAILRGEEPGIGKSWAPSPPALAAAVHRRLAPILTDIEGLSKVAGAAEWREEAIAPSARQSVIDGFADLHTSIAAAETEAAKRVNSRFLSDLADIDEKLRIRDCQREGIDPALGVTPTLLRLLKQQKEG